MARARGRLVILSVLLVALIGATVWLLQKRGDGLAALVGGKAKVASRPSLFAADPDQATEVKATSTLQGTVVNAAGQPVDGALVLLARTRERGAMFSSEFGRALQTARTSGGGHFRMERVQAGSYALTAMAEKYAPSVKGPVEVSVDETKTVELRLGAEGLLVSGRVLDVGGGPIAGAIVRATEFGNVAPTGPVMVPRVFQATSDEQGVYKLYLGRAQYGLVAEAEGYAPANDWFTLTTNLTRDLRLSPAARIIGRVVEREGGKPVADAELWLLAHRSGFRGRPRDVKTDANGVFAFNDLEPGTYRVGARKGRLVGMSTSVSVALAETVADVEVPVHAGLVVAGRVVDDKGQPVEGGRLSLYKAQPPYERPLFTKTDGEGKFQIEGVLPALYRLDGRLEGLSPVQQELRVTADKTDLNLKMGAGAVISGQVLGADGRPLADVTVNATVMTRDRNGAMERATTDANGKFEVKGLPPGDLTMFAQHKDQGSAQLKDQKLAAAEKKTVALKLDAGATVTGTIKMDDGSPAVGARVQAQVMGPGSGRWQETAGADGSYKLTGLPAGRVIIVASRNSNMMWGGPDRPDQKSVELQEREQKTGVDLIVAGAKKISGTVVAPDGSPVSGAEVSAALERDGRAWRGGMTARAFTSHDGTFTIEELGAGKHTVWAVHAGFADAENKGVEAGATGLQLKFPPESTLAGVVTRPDGKPVSNYTIVLASAPKANETPQEKRQRQFTGDSPTDVVHDPSGRFFFRRVGEGSHELRVTTADGSSGTQVVTVGAGEKKQGITIVIETGARIVGKVVDLDGGQPLADIAVRLFSPGAMGAMPLVRTDAGGTFTFDAVPRAENMMLWIEGSRPGGDPNASFVNERRRVDIPKGSPQADLGVIRLQRGSVEARMKEGTWMGGTGINNSHDDQGLVEDVRPNTPAAKAGLKAGDKMLAVDGQSVEGMSAGQIEWRLRGKPGSTITMKVQTPGEAPRTISFERHDFQREGATASGGTQGSGSRPAPAGNNTGAQPPARPAQPSGSTAARTP